MSRPIRRPLSKKEVQSMFIDPAAAASGYGPILSAEQFCELMGVSRSTFYQWIAEGRLANSAARQGKRWRILRDRALMEYFNGRDWNSAA